MTGLRLRQRVKWNAESVARLEKLWLQRNPRLTAAEIGERFGVGAANIYAQRARHGLPARESVPVRRVKGAAPDKTGQRRFTGVTQGDREVKPLAPHHPAARLGATRYGARVVPAIDEPGWLLKTGDNNRKIGRTAMKGRWSGQPIYLLTLEERATCPRTCKEWLSCYGNSMGHAHRIHDDGWLKPRLWIELNQLNGQHPDGFMVRLHVLGDFFSVDYVDFWIKALATFKALHIFGFTAHPPVSPIGRAVGEMMLNNLDRVAMRWSGVDGPLHTSEVVDKAEQASGIVCPAEQDPERCCATCGLCWQSERQISFIRHG